MDQPLVSVLIPLYRSKPFYSFIVENIEALRRDDVEIIVSDRHGDDDTIERLRDRFKADRRVRIVERRDRIGWVAHCNALLRLARGKYVRFTPHDDSFPPGSLEPLVARLERHAGAILAYSSTEAIDLDDATATGRHLPARQPTLDDEPWTIEIALDLFWEGYCDGAFKGLIRRATVVDAGAFIRPTYQLVDAERAWLFGLALLGRFCLVPESRYIKRYHAGSTHAAWTRERRHVASATAAMLGYLWTHHRSSRGRLWGSAYLLARGASGVADMTGVRVSRLWHRVEERARLR